MTRRNKRVLCGVALLGGGLVISGVTARVVLGDQVPIAIESLESKTPEGDPIYNRISWIPGWKKDVWLMQQSHRGLTPSFHQWDRLMIEVDKTKSPKVARFVQLEPGEMNIENGHDVRPFKVPCFTCHSNGPRTIRPNLASKTAALSLKDRMVVRLWNWRIRTYGRVLPDEAHREPSAVPFRYPDSFANEKFEVSPCTGCHNDSQGGRGHLVRQNATAIRFMVAQDFMPPPGIKMRAEERAALGRFVDGLP